MLSKNRLLQRTTTRLVLGALAARDHLRARSVRTPRRAFFREECIVIVRIPLAATFAPSDRARVFRSRVALDARACPRVCAREKKHSPPPPPTSPPNSPPPPSRDLQTTMNPVQEESQALHPKGHHPASSWVRKAVGGTCVVAGCAVAALAYGLRPLGVNTLADVAPARSSARTRKTPPTPRSPRILAKTRSYAREGRADDGRRREARGAGVRYLSPRSSSGRLATAAWRVRPPPPEHLPATPGSRVRATCRRSRAHDMCDSMFYRVGRGSVLVRGRSPGVPLV